MQRRAENSLGMTLVELMIVVVIIGILAAIAVVGYRKYIGRARLSEATAMIAEFSSKEQLYFLDNGQYVPAHKVDSNYPSDNETASEFWPSDPGAYFDSVRKPVAVYDSSGNMPTPWRRLGVRPRWNQLYCTYLVNAGCPASQGASCRPQPGSVGATLWGAAPNVPWFYVLGVCNIVGTSSAGWPNNPSSNQFYVTVMALTHDSPQIQTQDENM